ncbi:glucosaminidase domain-containing protein [Haliea sp. E1-2-M8]|uniref:glucosaminidase domain-containing protein n=1 Tax=Haliea sp. E1-2-M8 TaxID=3064706 RepID=UPI002715F08A|nr:glucosaminidase domain-containing protein [Haliea sp. E1-2-M8]MDO8862991.1 glucosaminidase domain-containing protein [Haliea sp. E1-2-M8]
MQSNHSGRKRWAIIAGLAFTVLACLWYVFKDHSSSLPDFSRFDQTVEMKEAFFTYMEPIITSENNAVREQRSRLKTIARAFEAAGEIGFYNRWRLNRLADAYGVPEDFATEMKIATLLQRVDIVPVELAAVQAAKESGWGRSRFAVKANNLFGHWCFDPGCGVVPENRVAGRKHELKAYDSVGEAIAGYMLNLNTHPKYLLFRQLRAQLREAEERLSGVALADGLLYYSERREAYVKEVKAMIRQYREFTSEMEAQAQT